MLTRLLSRPRNDQGVALVVAIALVALGTIMMITMTTLVLRENRQTARDRDRSVSINYAEGGIDTALAQIQNASVGSIPCGTSTRTATNASPETVTITTTITYYDATGAAISCQAAGGLSSTAYASQASVKSVATSTPRLGGQPVKRTMETLVALKPTYDRDLNRAIFGQAGVTVSNNFDLYGQNGPDADVYTNGDFSCTNNEHFRGSIYSQGSITLNGPCTVDGGAWAKNGFSMLDSKAYVGGDVQVSNGNADVEAGTIGGKVKAVTITPASFCQNSPAKCVTGSSAAPPPPSVAFPQVGVSTTPWVNNGYTVVQLSACDNSNNSPDGFLANKGQNLTGPTLIQVTSPTACPLRFKTSVKTVALNQNVAIFDPWGIDLENSLTFTSTDSTKHYLYFVQPYGSQCGPSTGGSGSNTFPLGIYLGNLVTMDPTISELLYSPCDVHKANQSSTYGQIYAGGTAYIDNKTSANYVPIPVFTDFATKIVLYYTADILYKRETLG